MSIRFTLIFFFVLLNSLSFSQSQENRKSLNAKRVNSAPKIDAVLDEPIWQTAERANNFKQREPYPGNKATQKSEVMIAYDNEAIYIAAILYDNAADSILKELSIRDNFGNTDWFSIQFDTFNDKQNRFEFGVTAAGVQFDQKTGAETFDVVWDSEVKITKQGWQLELKIPYMAIRFPEKDIQTWGMQISRSIRRNRELDQWQFISPDVQNIVSYYGTLNGIESIKSPIRLSFTPYVGINTSHYPYNVKGKSNWSSAYNAGLDLKYGINESFTLDMTLAPDFGQVQSDNKVLNLSAFEVQFQDYRPFFIEGTELFNLNNLFYSRRIGGTPKKFFEVDAISQDTNMTVVDNPQQIQLINATKVTGRTAAGLGIGFLNAITSEANARVRDSNGVEYNIVTEPFTNYNVVAFNQTLKNNSFVTLMNTNVTRAGNRNNANVTAINFARGDKRDVFRWNGNVSISNKMFVDSLSTGYSYAIQFAKVSGNFKYSFNRNVKNDKFDPNDLGILFYANEITHNANVSYNEFKPGRYFLSWSSRANIYYSTTYLGNKFQDFQINLSRVHTWKNWLTQWINVNINPIGRHDFYEPRRAGLKFIGPNWYGGNTGLSSDYRKPFALDLTVAYYRDFTAGGIFREISIIPIVRFSDKLKMNYEFSFSLDHNNQGYSRTVDEHIYFAFRDVRNHVNTLNMSYILNKNTSLTFRARHYWSTVEILNYKLLDVNSGNLLLDSTNYTGNNNFNVNFFNVDLVYSWRFAPGSDLIIVWKNSIETFTRSLGVDRYTGDRLLDSFYGTIRNNQTNTFNVKILYFLDYRYFTKNRS
jgi:hypothetical protein